MLNHRMEKWDVFASSWELLVSQQAVGLRSLHSQWSLFFHTWASDTQSWSQLQYGHGTTSLFKKGAEFHSAVVQFLRLIGRKGIRKLWRPMLPWLKSSSHESNDHRSPPVLVAVTAAAHLLVRIIAMWVITSSHSRNYFCFRKCSRFGENELKSSISIFHWLWDETLEAMWQICATKGLESPTNLWES